MPVSERNALMRVGAPAWLPDDIASSAAARLCSVCTASERRFVEDLMRLGYSESMVRRALFYMEARRELEHKRERRLIKRLA